MSHKVAKKLRKILRAGGNNPRDVRVAKGAPITKNINWATFSYGARILQANCGRALYRGMKKLSRAGAFA
jgi:hypothetical protein